MNDLSPLDEQTRRRPWWHESVPVPFENGQVWHIPIPYARVIAGSSRNNVATLAIEFTGYPLAELNVSFAGIYSQWMTPALDRWRYGLLRDFAAHLLRVHYDMTIEEAQALVNDEDSDPEEYDRQSVRLADALFQAPFASTPLTEVASDA